MNDLHPKRVIGESPGLSSTDPEPPGSSHGRATLKTVAKASGLAVTTVSRALNNHEDIAADTRERVQKIAREIGYVPNRQGRGLRTGRNHLISLVVPSHAAISGYTSSIIYAIGEVCRSHGYELAASPVFSQQDELDTIKSIVTNRRSDGIIVSRIEPQDLRVRYLLEQGFPFVTHGRTELATHHASVDFDNQKFTELATTRLIEQGRKTLMLIAPPDDLTYANHMKLGFQHTATRLGANTIETPPGISIETPLDELRAAITNIISSDNAPDGIVCGGELTALAVLGGIRDAGVTQNKDIAVIAKQTSSALDHTYPPIDTCYEDIAETGRLLAQALLQVIEKNSAESPPTVVVEPKRCWRLNHRTEDS